MHSWNCRSPYSYTQDYFCISRPLSPPVRRITMGTHHLEYGFPSTHSANGAGMTVFFYHCLLLWRTVIQNKGEADRIPVVDYLAKDTYLLEMVLILYAITIVYGRVYMGMHSVSGTWRGRLESMLTNSRLCRRCGDWCICCTLFHQV